MKGHPALTPFLAPFPALSPFLAPFSALTPFLAPFSALAPFLAPFLKRIGIAFFSTRRAIRGAWHPAPIAAILHRPIQSSAFLLSFLALVGVIVKKRILITHFI